MRIQHHLDSGIYDGHGGEIWGDFFYSMTVGLWFIWVPGLILGTILAIGITHEERKRKRRIRDLVRQGNFYEASIASAQNERAIYEENVGIAGGIALGVMGNENKKYRNQVLMTAGAGAIYNERQLEHFDSIDFEDHRRRHEAHLRKKHSAPQERPAQLPPTVTIVRSCANSDCRRRLRSTNRRASRHLVRCPECGREQWHTYP
jgi:hypothetical protein